MHLPNAQRAYLRIDAVSIGHKKISVNSLWSGVPQVHALGTDKSVNEFAEKGVTTRDAWLYPYSTDDVEAMCKASAPPTALSSSLNPPRACRTPSKAPRKATLFALACSFSTRSFRSDGAPS